MDYRVLGFRECASEVARYLVTVEGMDIQDPLRLRLMSHLQCYMAQREFQSRQHYSVSGHHPASQFSSHGQTPVLGHGQSHNTISASTDSHGALPPPSGGNTDTSRQMLPMITSSSNNEGTNAGITPSCHSRHPSLPPASASSAPSHTPSSNITPPSMSSSIPAIHTQYPGVTYNSLPVLSPNGFSPTNSSSHNAHSAIVSKPYRPWGTEMAYWTRNILD